MKYFFFPLCILSWIVNPAYAQEVPAFPSGLFDFLGVGESAAGVSATVASQTSPASQSEYQRAEVRILEFSSNKLVNIELVADHPVDFQGLKLQLQKCVVDHNGIIKNDAALIAIYENNIIVDSTIDADSNEGTTTDFPLFEGWLYALYPSAQVFDHPKYDIRLGSCLSPVTLSDVAPVEEASSDFIQEEELPTQESAVGF